MGDDGEMFSSNSSKPSLEGSSEEQHSIEEEEKLNANQCELAEEDMHAAKDDGEAAAAVGGGGEASQAGELIATGVGSVLEANIVEKVGGENSDLGRVDEIVTEEEDGRVEVQEEQAGEVKAAVATMDVQADATAADAEINDSGLGISVGRSDDDAAGDEAAAVDEEDSEITKSENLHSTVAADESFTVEEDVKMVVVPVESEKQQKEQESGEGEEGNAEGIVETGVKVDGETFIEVTQETKAENVTGLQGLQFVDSESLESVKEEKNQKGMLNDEEVRVADREMDDIKGMDSQCDVPESVVMISDEADKERLPTGILSAETELEKERKEVETEAVEKEEMVKQEDKEDKEMVSEAAFADRGLATEKYVENVGEESTLVERGRENEKEVAEGGDVESVPKMDDAEHVPQVNEVGEMVTEPESVLLGTETETERNLGEEQSVLGRGKEVETDTLGFDNVESVPKIDDEKLDEDKEMVEESALVGTGMETETDMGEERRLVDVEEGKEAGTETVEIGDAESFPKIDDAKDVPQDERDEDMVPEEESALADTEMETETDVGESSKAVGEKQKRGRNSKILLNSKTVSKAQKIMDEDVCFICFDGGELVLCDRR